MAHTLRPAGGGTGGQSNNPKYHIKKERIRLKIRLYICRWS